MDITGFRRPQYSRRAQSKSEPGMVVVDSDDDDSHQTKKGSPVKHFSARNILNGAYRRRHRVSVKHQAQSNCRLRKMGPTTRSRRRRPDPQTPGPSRIRCQLVSIALARSRTLQLPLSLALSLAGRSSTKGRRAVLFPSSRRGTSRPHRRRAKKARIGDIAAETSDCRPNA